MRELILLAAFVVTTTAFAGQLLIRRTSLPATVAAILTTVGGAAVCALMLVELVFGTGERVNIPGVPPDVLAAASVLVSVLNLRFAWTVLQARSGVLTGKPADVESAFRAACTLVLLNAPLIPLQGSATGVIVAAAVSILGAATAYMGGVVLRPAQPARRLRQTVHS